jgi:hypothetical protein
MEGKVTDKYVQSVKDKFEKRSQIGIQKYIMKQESIFLPVN